MLAGGKGDVEFCSSQLGNESCIRKGCGLYKQHRSVFLIETTMGTHRALFSLDMFKASFEIIV